MIPAGLKIRQLPPPPPWRRQCQNSEGKMTATNLASIARSHFLPDANPDWIHFVELSFPKAGNAFSETLPVYTEADCVRDVVDCQFAAPVVRVLAVNAKTGACTDATKRIADLAFYHVDGGDGDFGHGALRAFIEAHTDHDLDAYDARREAA